MRKKKIFGPIIAFIFLFSYFFIILLLISLPIRVMYNEKGEMYYYICTI